MIRQAFETSKTAFIPFIMAGHPTLEQSKQAIFALSNIGADMIEVGVPFSDPVADGIVNQRAAETALLQGVRLRDVLAMIRDVRADGCNTPILLFSYLNPILALGYDCFIEQAKHAGVNGVLVIDLPPEEGYKFYQHLQDAALEFALLASPTTDTKRLILYSALNPSFVYYISRLAVTGMQKALSESLATEIKQLRRHLPKTHIAVGFGISNASQAKQVAKFSDGVIVGSVLVDALNQPGGLEVLKQLAETIYSGLLFEPDDGKPNTT